MKIVECTKLKALKKLQNFSDFSFSRLSQIFQKLLENFFFTDHFSRCNLLSAEVLLPSISFLLTNKIIFTAPNIYNCLFSFEAHKSKFDYVPFPDMTEKEWKRVCKKICGSKINPFFQLDCYRISKHSTHFSSTAIIFIFLYTSGKKKWKTHIFVWYGIVMELGGVVWE